MRWRLTGIVLAGVLTLSIPAAVLGYAPRSAPLIDTGASHCEHYSTYTALYLYWDLASGKPRTVSVNGGFAFRLTHAVLRDGGTSYGDPSFHDSFTVTLSNRVGSDTETIVCPPRT